jgi:hypothetical protein
LIPEPRPGLSFDAYLRTAGDPSTRQQSLWMDIRY